MKLKQQIRIWGIAAVVAMSSLTTHADTVIFQEDFSGAEFSVLADKTRLTGTTSNGVVWKTSPLDAAIPTAEVSYATTFGILTEGAIYFLDPANTPGANSWLEFDLSSFGVLSGHGQLSYTGRSGGNAAGVWSWKIQGSTDGSIWNDIPGTTESFSGRNNTTTFNTYIRDLSTYSKYRLLFDDNDTTAANCAFDNFSLVSENLIVNTSFEWWDSGDTNNWHASATEKDGTGGDVDTTDLPNAGFQDGSDSVSTANQWTFSGGQTWYRTAGLAGDGPNSFFFENVGNYAILQPADNSGISTVTFNLNSTSSTANTYTELMLYKRLQGETVWQAVPDSQLTAAVGADDSIGVDGIRRNSDISTDTYTYTIDTAGDVELKFEKIGGTKGIFFDKLIVRNLITVLRNDSFNAKQSPAVLTGNVLANDTILAADTLTAITAGTSTKVNGVDGGGTVELLTDGTFTYTPANNFTGTATFDYTVNGQTATVYINVIENLIIGETFNTLHSSLNLTTAVTLQGHSYTASTDGTSDVDGNGIQTFIDNNVLMIEPTSIEDGSNVFEPANVSYVEIALSSPSNLTEVAFTADPTGTGTYWLELFVYNENSGWSQVYTTGGQSSNNKIQLGGTFTESLNITKVRLYGRCNGATTPGYLQVDDLVVLGTPYVAPALSAPQADIATAVYYTPLTVIAPGVLLNDNIAPGDKLKAETLTGDQGGSLVIAEDGSYVYTQSPLTHTGDELFTYEIVDATGTSYDPVITATITVTTAVKVPNTLVADNYVTARNSPLTTGSVLDNDTIVIPDVLTAINTGTTTEGGTVDLATDGTFTYTPTLGFVGTDSFDYTVGTESTTVTIFVSIQTNLVADLTDASNSKWVGGFRYYADNGGTSPTVEPTHTITTDGSIITGSSPTGTVEAASSGIGWMNWVVSKDLFTKGGELDAEGVSFLTVDALTGSSAPHYLVALQGTTLYMIENDQRSTTLSYTVRATSAWKIVKDSVTNDYIAGDDFDTPGTPDFTEGAEDIYYGFCRWGAGSGSTLLDTTTTSFTVEGLSGTLASLVTPTVGLEVVQNGTELTWTIDEEVGVKSYNVVDIATGEVIAVVDATGLTTYSVTVPEGVTVKLVVVDDSGFSQTFYPENGDIRTVAYNLTEGWNLITITTENADLSQLKKVTSGELWSWNGDAYEVTSSPQPTEGIWVYATAAAQVTVSGTKSDAEMTIATGWNLVGPVENSPAPSNATLIYNWNDIYESIAIDQGVLLQGVGYWIFSF